MKMILCTSEQYEKARAANPDAPILCTDVRQLHPPGYDGPGIVISPWHQAGAIESPNSEQYEP